MNSERFPTVLPHTFTDCRDAIVKGEEELIVDILKGDIAYQL
jgi:hypothetical protein